LKGTGYERGVQHWKQLKEEITQVYTKWKANIRNAVKGNPDSVITAFIKTSEVETIIRKYTPWLLKELRGISDGSGQKYVDVFAFQLVDEFWVYLDKLYNLPNHHCSSLGVASTKNRPGCIAQNTDLENFRNGYQVLFHLAATTTEPEQYILSCAGLIGLNGMNEYGIGICTNTLMELQASTDGMPVAFIVRGVLNKQNGNDALTFLKIVKHATGQNYILGIADSVYDFEASSNQIVNFFPIKGQNSLVYHTNHALANHDVKDWYKEYHVNILAGKTKNSNSELRFASLEKRLNIPPSEISTETIKKVLRSKDDLSNPVCRGIKAGEYGFTFSSVLFTLGGRRSVQLTCGPPDKSEYKEYFFKNK
jgi:isopenicillin-N N-acyltransferase like protein